MINLQKIEGQNLYSFTIEKGDITQEEVENFYKMLEFQEESEQKVKLLGIMKSYPGFKDFKAFSATMKMKMKAIKNIEKYAILSDQDWIETIMPVGNFITPGLPIKHFGLDSRDKAIAWLKEDTDKSYKEDEYLTKMNVNHIEGNIYSFTVDGKIDEAGISALYKIVKNKTKEGKINLIGYYKDFDGFDSFKAFTEGIKLDFASFSYLDKFAIVTDKKWVKNLAEIESKFVPNITMKGFKEDENTQALAWLKS